MANPTNNSFENWTGSDCDNWTVYSVNSGQAAQSSTPYDGTYAINCRSNGPGSTSSIGGFISDAFALTNDYITFWKRDQSKAVAPTVRIFDSSDVELRAFDLTPNTSTYQQHAIYVGDLKGQNIKIRFEQHTLSSGQGYYTYIDLVEGTDSISPDFCYQDSSTFIEITTIEELNAIRNNLEANYKLMNDLDFDSDSSYSNAANKSTYTTGSGWTPIGDSGTPFTGIFDGDGKTISNLFIDRSTTDNVGLIGYLDEGGFIRNLQLIDVDVTGQNQTGSLAGNIRGIASNCKTSGTVVGNTSVGGFIGYLNGSTSNEGTINGCGTTCNVSGIVKVGGFIGYFYNASTTSVSKPSGLIYNCYAKGSVTRISGSDDDFGGFCGWNYQARIINSYSTGAVEWQTAPHPTNKGFVGGEDSSGAYVDEGNCFDSTTSSQSTTTGNATAKTTAEMKDKTTFEGDFTYPWSIFDEGDITYTKNNTNVLELTGSNYVNVGSANYNTGKLTLAIKFKLTGFLSDAVGLISWGTWNNDVTVYLRSDEYQFSIVSGTGARYEAAYPKGMLNFGWHTLIVTMDTTAAETKVYLDEIFLGTLTCLSGGGNLPMSNNLMFGKYDAGNVFPGLLSDVRIYDAVVSDADRKNIFSNINVTDNLVGHWKLDEGSGTTLKDSVGSNDGSITSASWTVENVNSSYWYIDDTNDYPESYRASASEEYTATFEEQNGLDDVEISIYSDSERTTEVSGSPITTSGGGVASLDLVNGTYYYTISKYGYASQQGSFTVDEADFSIDFTLSSEIGKMDILVIAGGGGGGSNARGGGGGGAGGYVYKENEDVENTEYSVTIGAGGSGGGAGSSAEGSNGQNSLFCKSTEIALDFDGTNDYINVGTMGNFGSTNLGEFSFGCWVKSNKTNAVMTLIGGQASSTSPFVFITLNEDSAGTTFAGRITVAVSDKNTGAGSKHLRASVNLNTGITDGEWHHLVVNVKCSTNSVSIMVDNESQSITYKNQMTPSNFEDFTADIYLGSGNHYSRSSPTIDRCFTGNMKYVRLYNRELTSGEITNIIKSESLAPTTGLISYWKLDEGTGTTATDSAGSNDGTIEGATWSEEDDIHLLDAIGGGGGGKGSISVSNGRNGGCGGGGGSGGMGVGGSKGIGSQGYNGGTGNPWTGSATNRAGGGGGGIGGAGQNGVSGGWGGGAGGAGTTYWGTTYGQGGKGGDSGTSIPPGNGAANTGNGGNGAGVALSTAGGNGGSGIVVIRWLTADFGDCIITGVGNTITTDGDYSFAKFIVDGTFTPVAAEEALTIDVNESLILDDNVTFNVSKEVININESLILNDQNDIEEIIKKHKININEDIVLSEDINLFLKTFEEININETILLADDSNLNIPKESISVLESLELSEDVDIQTNIPLHKININENIILDDSSIITVPAKYAKKILSYNPLIILSGDSEVQITHVDVSDPDNPVSTTYDVSGITNANDITFNETNDYFYLCGSSGVIVKIDKSNLSNQTVINTGNSYNLLNNDSFDDFLRTYNITSNTDGELVVLDEREVKSLNTRIPVARLNASKVDCYARTILGKSINTDFRMSKLFTNTISTDIRVLKDEYTDLSQYPITRNDIVVKINDVDLLPLDDVDVQSIIITHRKDEQSHASFVLHRKHDKPNFDNQGNASEITNKNNVKIYIDGYLEFDGKISGFNTYSETESIMVNALMNEPSSSKANKSLPLASVGEKLSLYHCLSRSITIDNPYIDPDDENPDFYLGVEVDLGTKIEENITRYTYLHSVHEELEEGEFQPKQNWSYFWSASFEKTFDGTNMFGNYSITDAIYLGTSLGSLTTESYRILSAFYQRQKQYENIETELGVYRLGEAPYKEVSTKNGQLITKNKWADKADGLYREKGQSYNYIPYAKLVAELEYEKLKNINGDILPITKSMLDLTIDGYYYYAIKLLNRINLSNTTTPDIYKNQNGFPVAVKTITINTSTMKVSLECDNQLSIEELDDIDNLYPDDEDYIYPEESVLNFRKFDPNVWGYIQ